MPAREGSFARTEDALSSRCLCSLPVCKGGDSIGEVSRRAGLGRRQPPEPGEGARPGQRGRGRGAQRWGRRGRGERRAAAGRGVGGERGRRDPESAELERTASWCWRPGRGDPLAAGAPRAEHGRRGQGGVPARAADLSGSPRAARPGRAPSEPGKCPHRGSGRRLPRGPRGDAEGRREVSAQSPDTGAHLGGAGSMRGGRPGAGGGRRGARGAGPTGARGGRARARPGTGGGLAMSQPAGRMHCRKAGIRAAVVLIGLLHKSRKQNKEKR